MSNPIEYQNGTATWVQTAGDEYVVTGTDCNGRRFPAIATGSWQHASGINAYRGTVWLQRDGKRYRIRTINN